MTGKNWGQTGARMEEDREQASLSVRKLQSFAGQPSQLRSVLQLANSTIRNSIEKVPQ